MPPIPGCLEITNGFVDNQRLILLTELTADSTGTTRPLCSTSITGRFIARTGRSVLGSCIGTLRLAFLHLAVSLDITIPSSRSSTKAPESSSRHLYAGHHPPSKQVADGLVPGIVVAPGFDVFYSVSTPSRWFAGTRLLDSHLTHHMDAPSPSTLTTTVFSQCRLRVVWSRPL